MIFFFLKITVRLKGVVPKHLFLLSVHLSDGPFTTWLCSSPCCPPRTGPSIRARTPARCFPTRSPPTPRFPSEGRGWGARRRSGSWRGRASAWGNKNMFFTWKTKIIEIKSLFFLLLQLLLLCLLLLLKLLLTCGKKSFFLEPMPTLSLNHRC